MEEVTMERLLNNFAGVITQIEDIVIRKDIAQAKDVLEQVAKLVSNDEKVLLDDRANYDHVLHELLSKISGVIEIEDIKKIDMPDEMRIRLQELIERRRVVEERITAIDIEIENENKNKGNNNENNLEAQIEDLEKQLASVAKARRDARDAGNDQEEAIANSEYARITEEIAKLRSRQQEQGRNGQDENLEAQIEDLEKQLVSVAKARRDARDTGNNQEEAIANSEYARITEEIAKLKAKLNEKNNTSRNGGEPNSKITLLLQEKRTLEEELRKLNIEITQIQVFFFLEVKV